MTLNEAITIAEDCYIEGEEDGTESLYLYGSSVMSFEKDLEGNDVSNLHDLQDVKNIVEALNVLGETVKKTRDLLRK